MIAKVASLRGAEVSSSDPVFRETCRDVLRIDAIKITREGTPAASVWLDEILERHCSGFAGNSELLLDASPVRKVSSPRDPLTNGRPVYGNGNGRCTPGEFVGDDGESSLS